MEGILFRILFFFFFFSLCWIVKVGCWTKGPREKVGPYWVWPLEHWEDLPINDNNRVCRCSLEWPGWIPLFLFWDEIETSNIYKNKSPLETVSHIFLERDLAIFLWNSSPWPNCYAGFSNRPISNWVLAILFSCKKLVIPKHDARRFQLFASITMDLIWFFRNKLIHNAVFPFTAKVLHQILFNLDKHILAWNNRSSPSLWFPPLLGSFKGNFDVTIRGSFSVAATTISDSSRSIILTLQPNTYIPLMFFWVKLLQCYLLPSLQLLWVVLILLLRKTLCWWP